MVYGHDGSGTSIGHDGRAGVGGSHQTMNDTGLQVRVLESWLSCLRLDYIAKVENIPVAEVERIVAKAAIVPSGRLGLKVMTWRISH